MASLAGLGSICIAEYGGIKGLAILGLGLVAYLVWADFREKRELRRQRRAQEQRRRAKEAEAPQS